MNRNNNYIRIFGFIDFSILRRSKYLICVLMVAVFSGFGSIAQDYERIDASILLYPKYFDTPEQFSKFISRDFSTDEEKVRAIYSWIILNVSYDPEEYKRFNFNFKNLRERNAKEENTRAKVIQRTLNKGVAVCEGYAMLFEKMCELQGIQNYLVRGDIKSNFNDIDRPFKNSHMWNIAILDGETYLFDPTWGAGKYNGKFIREPSYFYYKTDPELLFKTHYPSMYEDALLDALISPEVFAGLPLIIWQDLKIADVEVPMMGTIRTDEYFDAVHFRINNCNPSTVNYSYGGKKLEVKDMEYKEGKLHFSIPLELGVKTLLIYFDDQPALGYRIQ